MPAGGRPSPPSRGASAASCRPPTGKVDTARKPAWALTEAEHEQLLDLDVDELMNFLDTLDFDAVMSEMDDKIQHGREEKSQSVSDSEPVVEVHEASGAVSERLTLSAAQTTAPTLTLSLNGSNSTNNTTASTVTSHRTQIALPATALASGRPSTGRPATASSRPHTTNPSDSSHLSAGTVDPELIAQLKCQPMIAHVHSTNSIKSLVNATTSDVSEINGVKVVSIEQIKQENDRAEHERQVSEAERAELAALQMARDAPYQRISSKLDPSRLPYLRRCPAV